jgi:uncharacterized protein (TIGR02594 family)
MITRRAFAGAVFAVAFPYTNAFADEISEDIALPAEDLLYPPFEALTEAKEFGYKEPSSDEKAKAETAIKATPHGPTPIAVMQSFVARYYDSDPKVISQWPAPNAWNPIIVEFFKATSNPVNNDMVPWCAASANWCIEWAGGKGSRSAASQSFLDPPFQKVRDPKVGDLAVFTCYEKSSGANTRLGHVGFVAKAPANNAVLLVGGNTAKDAYSSIICQRYFQTTDRDVWRHIGNKRVLCTMRLNSYVAVV